jgi:heme exporter protein CcmD
MKLSEFLSMGGYAFFVWGSYITAFLAIGGEIILVWRRSQALKNAATVAAGIKNNEKTS